LKVRRVDTSDPSFVVILEKKYPNRDPSTNEEQGEKEQGDALFPRAILLPVWIIAALLRASCLGIICDLMPRLGTRVFLCAAFPATRARRL